MNTCKTCKFWQDDPNKAFRLELPLFNYCSNEKFIYSDYKLANDKLESLFFADAEGYKAWLLTGPDFGCIPHQKLEEYMGFIVGDRVRLTDESISKGLQGSALSPFGDVIAVKQEQLKIKRDGIQTPSWYKIFDWEPPTLVNERDPLIEAVKGNRNDPMPRLIYGDWLEEHGNTKLANAYRWMGYNEKYPYQNKGKMIRKRWWWILQGFQYGHKECPESCFIPRSLFFSLSHKIRHVHNFFTEDEAILALANALFINSEDLKLGVN